jgi:citrate synthase
MADIRDLYREAGCYAYDPALGETGICRSAITYVDGDNGVLLYGGYPIADLVERCSYLEICWLLLNGELPTETQLDKFTQDITHHTMVNEQLHAIYRGFRRDSHPMAVMCGVGTGGLLPRRPRHLRSAASDDRFASAHREDADDRRDGLQIFARPALRISAKRLRIRRESPPHVVLGSVRTLPGVGRGGARPRCAADHPGRPRAECFDHGDATRRIYPSQPYACTAAAIAALWGPLHGGANEAVLQTLAEIGSVDRIPETLRRAKDKNKPFRLMGFGHRVYKSYDPRAKVLRQRRYEVLDALGQRDDPLLKLAMELERVTLEDDYFIERKLYPNVDFYSGIIFRALGLPSAMFTPVFAVARTVGWVAHWNEMIADPETRIFRPRQLYTGPAKRELAPLAERAAHKPLVG